MILNPEYSSLKYRVKGHIHSLEIRSKARGRGQVYSTNTCSLPEFSNVTSHGLCLAKYYATQMVTPPTEISNIGEGYMGSVLTVGRVLNPADKKCITTTRKQWT